MLATRSESNCTGLEAGQTLALDLHAFAGFQILDESFEFFFRFQKSCFVGIAQIDAEVGLSRYHIDEVGRKIHKADRGELLIPEFSGQLAYIGDDVGGG